MTRKIRKQWIGIGVATLAGAVAATTAISPVSAQHGGHGGAPPKDTAAPDKATPTTIPAKGQLAAPQGGEAYLTDGGPKDTRIRIYRDIALMRGHLLVGAELIELGLWEEALPHFLHPAEELYGAMERYIKLHKIPPFDRQLKALAQAVKAKNKPAYVQAAKVTEERIAAALAGFKRFMTVQPFSSYTAQALAEIAKVALAEYAASIENGRFTKPVEYQDSRGFIWHAEQVIARHAAEFEKVDAAAFTILKSALAELKPAWPTAVPPEKPVIDVATLAARIDAFTKATERFR